MRNLVDKITIDPALVAPCGIDCRLCRAYVRERKPCPGCRFEGPHKPVSCTHCRIKQGCELLASEEVAFCFECSRFPCGPIQHLDKRYRTRYATSPIDNLLTIRDEGISRFLAIEAERWTCPRCGALLSMHNPLCLACGYAWHS
jgi:hypothetical protein